LSIGFTTYYETQLMSPLLHQFMAEHPEIDITISQDNFRDNNQALLSQTVDILFSRNYGLNSIRDFEQIETTTSPTMPSPTAMSSSYHPTLA